MEEQTSASSAMPGVAFRHADYRHHSGLDRGENYRQRSWPTYQSAGRHRRLLRRRHTGQSCEPRVDGWLGNLLVAAIGATLLYGFGEWSPLGIEFVAELVHFICSGNRKPNCMS